MNIVIFGANGPTGQLLTAQALAAGHRVTAFTRKPDSFPLRDESLDVVGGDVFDADMVERAVTGQDVVLSTLGVPFSKQPITVYSHGTSNIIAAMRRHDVSRFAGVTSSALDLHPDQEGGFMFKRVIEPWVTNKLGKTLYLDMGRMERIVAESDLDWTIVRPSGLFGSDDVTDYVVADRFLPGRFTSRADLAHYLLRQATERDAVRRFVAVNTVSVRMSMLTVVWREGIKKKRPIASSYAVDE